MNPPAVQVAVWMQKRTLTSRWASHDWHAAAVVDGADRSTGFADAVRFDGFEVALYRDEAEGYYLNTSTGDPKAFVMWRMEEDGDGVPVPKTVTLSYNEAARQMDAQERVDMVALPAGMRAWLEAFVAEHYKPEPKKKRVKASFVAPRDKAGL
jgi:Protein of unknown function (DUF3305)